MRSDAPSPRATRDSVIDAVLSASRVLVAVAARSLGDVAEEVTLTQFRTLVVLASRGPQSLATLAEAVDVTPSTATRMCDRLVRKGLIARRHERGDRRLIRLTLTASGQDLVTRSPIDAERRSPACSGRSPTISRPRWSKRSSASPPPPAKFPSRTGRLGGTCRCPPADHEPPSTYFVAGRHDRRLPVARECLVPAEVVGPRHPHRHDGRRRRHAAAWISGSWGLLRWICTAT